MNCEQVEELLSAYLDNMLAPEERRAVAAHLQVPVDGPALVALAVLASACPKRIRVRRLADGYEQPLNLYLLGLGEPGERKSGHGLARATFADHAEDLAGLDREGDPVEHSHAPARA